MSLPTCSQSLTYRIAAVFMALALLVAGQAAHVPVAHADAEAGTPHAMSGHTPAEPALDIGDAMPPADGLQSELDCAGTECGSCAATVTSSARTPAAVQGLPSDHAVINVAVGSPERLFRPPIRLS
jgi:ferredoxin